MLIAFKARVFGLRICVEVQGSQIHTGTLEPEKHSSGARKRKEESRTLPGSLQTFESNIEFIWVLVKELHVSYHNRDLSQQCGFLIIASYIKLLNKTPVICLWSRTT